MRRRLACLADFDLAAHDHIDIKDTLECLRRLDKFIAVSWLKTVCNGWCTSHRMHEDKLLQCIFGCVGCKDTLSHYLSCPILWSIIDSVFRCPIGPTVFHRLGLHAPSPQTIIMLVTAQSMYHTLKVGHRHIALHALTSRRFGPCIEIITNIASEYRSQYAHVFHEVASSNSLSDFD